MKRFLFSILSLGRKCSYSTSADYFHLYRSYMYVPGDKSKMIDKILTMSKSESPDITIFDLEDGVGLKNKDLARSNILSVFQSDKLKSNSDISACIRINSMSLKDEWDKDLDMISEIFKVSNYDYPRMINIAKVENINDLLSLDQSLKQRIDKTKLKSPIKLGIMIENCVSIANLNELCRHFTTADYSCFRLDHAVFGSDDYCASMGISRTPENTEVLYARQHFVNVMKACKVSPIDMVDIDIHNLEALEKNCKFGANIGFVGKQVIHPKQLAVVNKCFSPSDETIQLANALLKEYEIQHKQNAGAFAFMGRMIDMPSILAAQHVAHMANLINKKQNS